VPAVPDYAVGDTAAADVVTPIPLVVFDPARTETLRKAEAQKVTPIFRHYPNASNEAEATLQASFAETRSRFTAGLEEKFNHPPPLLSDEQHQPAFAAFVEDFRKQNPAFPLGAPLAELWALGDSGDVALNEWMAAWRRVKVTLVRDDALPPGERLTTASVRLIAASLTDTALTLATVDKQGKNVARTNLIQVSRLRREVQRNAGPEELDAVKFITGLLRPNCFFDAELTGQARRRRIAAINVADRYEAGQAIVKQGEKVDGKTKLALDELRVRTAADRVRAGTAVERAKTEAAAARHSEETTRRVNLWLRAGLSASALLLAVLGSIWFRHRRQLALAPLDSSLALTVPGDLPTDESGWRDRALAAEARAQKATAMLRASLLPHLARWMMNELVQRLLSQRSHLLTGQQKAEREVAELAARLEEVHAPLEDRLRAYEQRIAQLEAELAAKGEQNLDLIKAKIEMTRKKLEGERSQQRPDWN
jgi:hypothetical protein